jgi:hypothetical protein
MAAELRGDVLVVQRHVVDVDATVDDPHRVPLARNHAFHEHLLGVERVVEHHDVARPRFAKLVDQLVDDQPVVILQRRRHAQAVDARDLKAERDDQRRVDRRGHERLEAGDDLAPHPLPCADRVGDLRQHGCRRWCRRANAHRHPFHG